MSNGGNRHPKFPMTKGAAYGLVVAYVCVIVVAIISALYSNHLAVENNKKWCHVLVAIDDAYKDANVTSSAGKHIAEEFHQQRLDFKC